MKVTVIDEETVVVDTVDGEMIAVRVAAINGGFLWIFDKTARPVGRAVRLAIDAAQREKPPPNAP